MNLINTFNKLFILILVLITPRLSLAIMDNLDYPVVSLIEELCNKTLPLLSFKKLSLSLRKDSLCKALKSCKRSKKCFSKVLQLALDICEDFEDKDYLTMFDSLKKFKHKLQRFEAFIEVELEKSKKFNFSNYSNKFVFIKVCQNFAVEVENELFSQVDLPESIFLHLILAKDSALNFCCKFKVLTVSTAVVLSALVYALTQKRPDLVEFRKRSCDFVSVKCEQQEDGVSCGLYSLTTILFLSDKNKKPWESHYFSAVKGVLEKTLERLKVEPISPRDSFKEKCHTVANCLKDKEKISELFTSVNDQIFSLEIDNKNPFQCYYCANYQFCSDLEHKIRDFLEIDKAVPVSCDILKGISNEKLQSCSEIIQTLFQKSEIEYESKKRDKAIDCKKFADALNTFNNVGYSNSRSNLVPRFLEGDELETYLESINSNIQVLDYSAFETAENRLNERGNYIPKCFQYIKLIKENDGFFIYKVKSGKHFVAIQIYDSGQSDQKFLIRTFDSMSGGLSNGDKKVINTCVKKFY